MGLAWLGFLQAGETGLCSCELGWIGLGWVGGPSKKRPSFLPVPACYLALFQDSGFLMQCMYFILQNSLVYSFEQNCYKMISEIYYLNVHTGREVPPFHASIRPCIHASMNDTNKWKSEMIISQHKTSQKPRPELPPRLRPSRPSR